METCKTCRHWNGVKYSYSEPEGAGDCLRIELMSDIFVLQEIERRPDDTAWVQYGEMYSARLITLPTFGCTMHEPIADAN